MRRPPKADTKNISILQVDVTAQINIKYILTHEEPQTSRGQILSVLTSIIFRYI